MRSGARRAASDPGGTEQAIASAHREHWSRLVALLATRSRRLDLAEDCVQEAFAIAAARWPADGVPDNPPAWLLTTARRRMIDRIRSESAAERRLRRLVVDGPAPAFEDKVDERLGHAGEAEIPDERLRLLFVGCHPALDVETRVALTLRFVGGLTVTEIARLLLVQEATMAARITRAKRKIAVAGIPFRVPAPDQLGERVGGVAAVLYLMFTEGYAATSGPSMMRVELADEAVRLTRSVAALLPDQPGLRALLALMLLQHARRDARFSGSGDIVLLPEQDRSRWHGDEIALALALLAELPDADDHYLLQARIAAEHGRAVTADDTDWAAIERLYVRLERVTGSPVVRMNRAVAAAEARGPLAGLAVLDGLDAELPRSHQLPAVRAELLHRLGDDRAATAWYDRALALVRTDPERRHLERRRATCT